MDSVVKHLSTVASESETDKVERPSREEVEQAVRILIAWTGDDPDREGLVDTPSRVAKAFKELYGGYEMDPDHDLTRTFEEVGGYEDIVLVRDIPFFSHCEHHMVPFTGKAHVAYYPSDRVVGLSKLARVVEIYARRLQTQENLTAQITTAINEGLAPRGVAVLLESEHMCMSMRGIRKQGSSTITNQYTGVFADDPAEQKRFLDMIQFGKA